VSYRDQAIVLALCFWADEEQLFLKDELKEGRIDQFSYNYALAVAKIYKNLWKLIKVDETGIQKILSNASNFPFDSSRALFVEIVREVIEGEFCSCLKRRYIYNASHINKIAKLKRKVHQETASSAEISKLYKLIDQYVPFSIWLNRLLIVADRLSSKNSLVKEYLENYRDGISTLAKLQIQRDCNPDFRHHKISTHTWERGQRYQGVLSWKA
jgi:predicted nucleic acid-binding protein